jgi:cytidylate kinase
MIDGAAETRNLVIAIDGPSAAGKGTLARRLAAHYDLAYLDTGLIYRAVAAQMLAVGRNPEDEATAVAVAKQLKPDDIRAPGLRTEAVSTAAAAISSHFGVRAALLDFQRKFARHPPLLADGKPAKGAVLDGRDIGTQICPHAQVKFFVMAALETRARRRFEELLARDEAAIYADVLKDMQARDLRDATREAAPLRPAPDAFVIDSSELDADAVFERAVAHIDGLIGRDRQPAT